MHHLACTIGDIAVSLEESNKKKGSAKAVSDNMTARDTDSNNDDKWRSILLHVGYNTAVAIILRRNRAISIAFSYRNHV